MISYSKNKVNKLSVKIKYIQILLDGAYRPTDFKCEITLFWDIKRPGNGFSVTRAIDLL